jgi:PIN domain nuclease of toxin-antitoxin system
VNGRVEYVLDSSALLAVLSLETGHQRVKELLGRSVISSVNLAEVANKVAVKTPSVEAARAYVAGLELRIEDWTEEMAYRSAEFTQFNKSHGLSLGDRACLTLAKQLHATAVTADRTWRRLPSLGVRVMIFR